MFDHQPKFTRREITDDYPEFNAHSRLKGGKNRLPIDDWKTSETGKFALCWPVIWTALWLLSYIVLGMVFYTLYLVNMAEGCNWIFRQMEDVNILTNINP